MYLCKELEMSQIKPRIKNQNKTRSSTISYVIALLPLLSACGNGGSSNGGKNTPLVNSQLILTAPSIVPSLPGKIGNNYLVVSNNSSSVINGISYSLGNQVGAGSKLVLDSQSIANCSNIMAYTNCYIKLSVAESAIAGAAIVTASANNVNTNAAIGIQQVPFNNVANANGVGLYFYNKVQYSQGGFPYILVTAVIQSSKLGNINTVQLVNESGTLISGQFVVSNNSGPDKSILQQGDVVEIALPIPQGVGLSQNMKVQTSYQTVSTNNIDKLSHANHSLNGSTTNTSTGTTIYSFTTQGSNINLQLIPNQIFLTATNPSQSGFLYNIGDMTASQIQTGSSSQNVNITNTTTTLNKQEAVAINYQLQNTASTPTINSVFATAQNPSGQVQVNFGQTGQNVSPNVTPTPSPTPTPTPSPSPAPGPSPGPSPSPIPALTITSNQNPQAGGVCSTLTATVPSPVGPATLITFAAPSDPNNYGFAASAPYPSSATCTIAQGSSSCSTSVGNNLCAATGATAGTPITVVGGASGYTTGSVNLTIAAAPTTLMITSSKRPYAGGSCSNVTATISQIESIAETINLSVSGSGAGTLYGFGLADSASYPTTASCTIAAGNTSCSLIAESLCATESAVANTPIAIAANAIPGGYSTSANTTVTATYAYIGNAGSGVIQCLVSDLNGTLSECVTKDDPITSDDLASVTLDPYTSYLYLLPSANKVNPYYYACPVNASGQYTNPDCLPNKAITTQYGSIAFALTNGTEYAYLAGRRDGISTGSAVDYCLVQESVLYCQPQYTGFTNPNNIIAAMVNQTTYIYVTTLTGSIQKCNINNSAGFGNCTSNVVGSISNNKTGLSVGYDNIASLPAESSNYYGYITVPTDTTSTVYFCPIDSATGMLDCNVPYQFTGIQNAPDGINIASTYCTANYTSSYNNQPYLYICGAGSDGLQHIFICPINNMSYDTPPHQTGGDADACYTSIVTNTTKATNISFGTY